MFVEIGVTRKLPDKPRKVVPPVHQSFNFRSQFIQSGLICMISRSFKITVPPEELPEAGLPGFFVTARR